MTQDELPAVGQLPKPEVHDGGAVCDLVYESLAHLQQRHVEDAKAMADAGFPDIVLSGFTVRYTKPVEQKPE